MSFAFSTVAAKVAVAAAVLVTVVAFAAATPVSAQETSLSDSIAQAKSKVWGEYPKAEKAYPEFATKIVAAPAKTESVAQAAAPVAKAETAKIEKAAPVTQETAKVESATVVAPAPVETVKTAAVTSSGDALIDEIVRLTNEARATEDLAPLSINVTLNQASAIRAAELPSSPAPHLRPDGAAFYTVFKEVGLSPKKGGENYAIGTAGAFSAEVIVNAWMNSPSHRKNIMNANYTDIGIGYTTAGGNDYFEQLFIA